MLSSTNNNSVTRILVADDQQDVLDALRLLLKAEGFKTETVASPRAVLKAMESSDFDVLLMDLNYARDSTSGQEGLDLLRRIQALDQHVARHRHDRLGKRRARGGSDAPRGT